MSAREDCAVAEEVYGGLPVVGSIQAAEKGEIQWGVQACPARLRLDPNVSQPNLYSSLILDAAMGIGARFVIDLGCGTGALGIGYALSQRVVERVLCVDIDPAAVALAKENAILNGLRDRVRVIESDWFSGVGDVAQCELIVSSPPHTPCSPDIYADVEAADPGLARSSFGGPDGLSHISQILGEAASYCERASLVMAVGSFIVPGLHELAIGMGFQCLVSRRVVVQLSPMAARVRSYVESECNFIFPEVCGRLASEITVLRLEPRSSQS